MKWSSRRDLAFDLMEIISILEFPEYSRPRLLMPSKFETDFMSAYCREVIYF